ncbi:MAG: hypothetical protein AAF806_25590 [Bacteroidota bacterium]
MVQPDERALLKEAGSDFSYGICFEREEGLSYPVEGRTGVENAF